MKKITLVLAVMLLGVTFATASEKISELDGKDLRITKRYRFMQPIMFVERGVEFLIFPMVNSILTQIPVMGILVIITESRHPSVAALMPLLMHQE